LVSKLPGAKSTKLKIPLERLEVASFFMPWETKYAKRECIVVGCDHIVGGVRGDDGMYTTCGTNNQPAICMDKDQIAKDLESFKEKGKEARLRAKGGPACICCVDKIMALG
jgi:hypothetical protein